MTGPKVVAAWGVLLVALLGIHLGYGGGRVPTFPFVLLGCAATITFIVALVAFWVHRTGRTQAWVSPAPRASHVSLAIAVLGLFIGVGLIYRPWMMAPAIYPLFILVRAVVSALAAHPEPEPVEVEGGGRPPATAKRIARDVSVTAAVTVGGAAAASSLRQRLRLWRKRRRG